MYCRYCGNKMEADQKFCNECGKPTQVEVAATVNKPMEGSARGLFQNKNIIIGGLIAVAVIIAAMVFMEKGDINSSAMSVTKAVFKAIDECDSKAFVRCITPEAIIELKEYSRDYTQDIKYQLKEADSMFEEEFGKNWYNKMKYNNLGDGYIEVTIEGESEDIVVERIGGKYYIDPYYLF